ncbi:MAG: endolytic transglycosylase MltG, partial [Patescibacteria group bacterium]
LPMTDDISIFSMPKPRRSYKRRVVTISVTIITVMTLLGIHEIYFFHPPFIGSRTIEIPSGFGSRMIGERLKQQGFIRSKWMFVIYVTLHGEASLLKPGTYDLTSIPIPRIAQTLVKGAARKIIITLPEGQTISDLEQILQNNEIVEASTFAQFAVSPQGIDINKKYPFLNHASVISGLEGYLFPDTYYMFKNARSEDIADVFLQNFDKKITPEIHSDIVRSKKNLHDIIIMASLIEKEVISDQDRKMVSGILWNRLRIGIPLQVDATINYVKKQHNIAHAPSGRISHADLFLQSPYNTYLHRGLPAGPIGNPGLSAITAAIHPTSSPYLYYLSTPDGRTIFSRTLEEHNRAKAKYLKS